MGSNYNKSEENEEQNTVTLNKDGILEFVRLKIHKFRNKTRIVSIVKTYLNSINDNKLTEPYKWTNYKDNKYTEKCIEIFSFELRHRPGDEFEMKYYFYYGYYLKYYDFRFESDGEEKRFRNIVMNIDENFNLENKMDKIILDTDDTRV